jgi:hypothetical protein
VKEKYWFKTHTLRFGWMPNSWQGWGVVIVYLIITTYTFLEVAGSSHSLSAILIHFIPKFFVLSALLIVVTYLKSEPLSSDSRKEHHKDGR